MNHLPDEKLNKALLFAAYAFLAISAGLSVYLLFGKNIDYPASLVIVDLISIVFALMYFINGYKKDGAKYFKIAMGFKASAYIIDILCLAINPNEDVITSQVLISFALTLIMYGNTLLVAVGKDLGKRVSLIIYGSNLVLYLISIFVNVNTGTASEISTIIWVLMTFVGLIMIKAKYIDKENRDSF